MRPSLRLLLLLLTGLGLRAHGGEIIRGKRVPDGEMLYMASVQSAKGKHICGGFLISSDTVVTAAHCDKWQPTSVVLGTHNLNNKEKSMRYNVTRCKHHSYKEPINGNDIMLLKLSEAVSQKNKRIKTIQLPRKMKIKDNSRCWVAGWGITTPGGRSVHQLERVDVRYMNLNSCRRQWQGHTKKPLPNTVMCAGGFTPDGKGFCQGDSGGPLVCDGKAVGIVSFNYRKKCDYPNLPNVYTNLSNYLPWINQIIKKKKC